jgi:hypothetical protein
MMCGLNCAILVRALLRLSIHIEILITDSTKLFLRNQVNRLMIALRFEPIVSTLHSCGPLAYSDNEHVKQLLYALDDHVWSIKITVLKESADFATLDTKKLFSKLKSHELSKNGCPNHDASLSSKTLITSARVGSHDANLINTTVSFALEFALSSLFVASDEQYESIPDDEIALLVRKLRALHMFHKERRRSPRTCFECV